MAQRLWEGRSGQAGKSVKLVTFFLWLYPSPSEIVDGLMSGKFLIKFEGGWDPVSLGGFLNIVKYFLNLKLTPYSALNWGGERYLLES